MKYSIIQVPNIKTFNNPLEASDSDVKELFTWFAQNIDERISKLESAVQSTKGFEEWKATFDPES